ncbi:MAG: zf-HC2 domain-containing protein [Gammaproteobacteria bacterium]|nr:zf-HC2 domain-containing protein [Gammaproteobacteria bacterium]
MNCQTAQNQIDDYLVGRLHPIRQAQLDEHLAECEKCAQLFDLENKIKHALIDLDKVPGPRKGFADEVFAALERPASKSHRKGFTIGFSSAIAASLAVWLGVTVFLSPETSVIPATNPGSQASLNLPVVKVSVAKVHPLRVLFNAPGDMQDVTLTVKLPPMMELSGYPGVSEMSWKTDLHQGQNVLKLPVVAHQAMMGGEVITKIENDGKAKVLKVLVDAIEDGQVRYVDTNQIAI